MVFDNPLQARNMARAQSPDMVRPRIAAANARLRQEISHAALWLVICLAGGCTAMLTFYLVAGRQAFDQVLPSICNAIGR
jgi:hypothetical protein